MAVCFQKHYRCRSVEAALVRTRRDSPIPFARVEPDGASLKPSHEIRTGSFIQPGFFDRNQSESSLGNGFTPCTHTYRGDLAKGVVASHKPLLISRISEASRQRFAHKADSPQRSPYGLADDPLIDFLRVHARPPSHFLLHHVDDESLHRTWGCAAQEGSSSVPRVPRSSEAKLVC